MTRLTMSGAKSTLTSRRKAMRDDRGEQRIRARCSGHCNVQAAAWPREAASLEIADESAARGPRRLCSAAAASCPPKRGAAMTRTLAQFARLVLRRTHGGAATVRVAPSAVNLVQRTAVACGHVHLHPLDRAQVPVLPTALGQISPRPLCPFSAMSAMAAATSPTPRPAEMPSSSGAAAPTSPVSPIPPPALITKKRRWTIKHQLSQRHAHESSSDPSFFTHSKHVLVCSWAGRPIYSRYGDDSKLAGYTGVLTALIENYRRIHRQQDIRSVRAGVWSIVFKLAGPLYLIAISRTGEGCAALLSQLDYVHLQILSVLTGQVSSILQQRPQYDVRHLMSGTENLLSDLLVEHDRNYCFLLGAVHLLPLPRAVRSRIVAALRKGGRGHLYGVLLSSTQLIALQNNTRQPLSARDLLLLINFLHNSQSLQASDSFTPICLPDFNSTGYLYAYTSFLTEQLVLALLTANNGDILPLKDAQLRIVQQLAAGRTLEELAEAAADPYIDIHEIEGMGVGELLHMLYVQGGGAGANVWGGGSGGGVGGGGVQGGQLLQSHFAVPFHDTRGKRRLFRCYERVIERGRMLGGGAGGGSGGGGVSLVWEVCDVCSVLMLSGREGLLLIALLNGVDKTVAMTIANKIMRWIKKEEQNLFF